MASTGAVPEKELRRSIVRVLNRKGGTGGTAFLVSDDLIATCARDRAADCGRNLG